MMPMDTTIRLRLTEREKGMFEGCAEREHLTLSAWLRQAGYLKAGVHFAPISKGPGVSDAQPKPEARAALRSQEPTPAPTAPVLHVPVKGRSHDPANCRLYGCGRCQAAGINDARRGL